MKSEDVSQIVRCEIDEYQYEKLEPGTTLGVPWSEEKVLSYIPKLESALVPPYQQKFYLRDTYDQVKATETAEVTYWVVAKTDSYIEFFDPVKKDFGLACASSDGELPSTIGVRGDLVGVFAAM
jgi:hypothetical protein